MISVIWSDTALDDLAGIRDYIDQFHPQAAQEFAGRLKAAGNSLQTFPLRGRRVPNDAGLRELTIAYPYIIRYEVLGDTVTILGIRHGMRDSPDH